MHSQTTTETTAGTSAGGMLAAALAAAGRGWPVFPVRPDDKRPALHGRTDCPATGACSAGHQGWESRATVDPERIRAAWSRAPFNVGIATGPARLVVIDLDTPKPGQVVPPEAWPGVHDGRDVLAVIAERAGAPLPLDTFTVTTGRGGAHLYFRHPDGGPELRNTAGGTGGLGWLIDTRAHGGYILAAGSVVAGRPYTVLHDAPVAPLPGWLAELLAPVPLPAQTTATVALAPDRLGGYLRAAVDGEVTRVTTAPPGGRNTALYRAAVALGQLAAGGQLAAADVTAWLTTAATAVGQQPGETARTIASGLRAGTARPRTLTPAHAQNAHAQNGSAA